MADYDIAQAFAEIEDELISSMVRNLKHHKAEETKEGFKWSQWQAEQLKSLEEYKANNKKLFAGRFDNINTEIENAIQSAYKQGGMEQEIKILKAIKNGYKPPVKSLKSTKTTGEFFKLNERKLNALIKSTTNDMKKAEQAVLRRANDHYRKIIYNAQVYANAGGTTYEKAVDMATRDFLRSGIDCIEYSNGARHTISDYADMAVKTANKRAYLRGEGTKREEWGIHTVIVNKRGNPCPLCLPWVGKILIDDVYSGGTPKEAEKTGYSLLSEAMAEGFLHPRCQDAFTTYFEGVITPPEQEQVTADEEQTIKENNSLKQKQQYHQLMAGKCQRIADNSLDEDNKRIYTARATEHTRIADEISEKITDEPVEKSAESGIIKTERETSPRKNKKCDFSVDWSKIQSDEYSDKFKKLSENKRVYSSIETRAKWSLNNRDGLDTEEIYAVDLTNGDEVAKITDQHYKQGVKRTPLFTRKLNEADNKGHNILLLHNHPNGLPPSINDINALLENKNVSGITVGHNGSIYHYTRPKTPINIIDYNVKLRHYKNLDEIECIETALFDLQEKFGFTITKL